MHKKALYNKFSLVKVVHKTSRKDYIFFLLIFKLQRMLSFRHYKICGLISPRAMSDSVKGTVGRNQLDFALGLDGKKNVVKKCCSIMQKI